jgi:hypothetical protein
VLIELFYIELNYSIGKKNKTNLVWVKIIFLRRYADLLAKMEEYARSFAKNYNATGQVIDKLEWVFCFYFYDLLDN